MNWKQEAWLWFNRAAHFWLVQTLIVYLWGCMVAEKPISPKDYVRFNYHVIQWRPGEALPARAANFQAYGTR